MFRSSFKVATVWGIPIKIHVSLFVLLAFLALSWGRTGGPVAIALLLVLEALVFFSIALHELGHSYVAIKKGCRVREITLMFIGGAARMERIPSRPRDELQMAIAGPLVSLILGAAFFFGGRALLDLGVKFFGTVIMWAGIINFVLAGFNLLPSFPMDGGRVLRALLTPRMGRLRATFIAARLGKVVAIIFGLYGFLSIPTKWMFVAIAFFVYTAAGAEYRMVAAEEAAKRGGFSGWPFSQPPPATPEDEVVIGPAPFEKGSGSRARVEEDEEDQPLRFFR